MTESTEKATLATNNSHHPLTTASSGPTTTGWREQAAAPDSPWSTFGLGGPTQTSHIPFNGHPPPSMPLTPAAVSVNFAFPHQAPFPFIFPYPPTVAVPTVPSPDHSIPSNTNSTRGAAGLDALFAGNQPGLMRFGQRTGPLNGSTVPLSNDRGPPFGGNQPGLMRLGQLTEPQNGTTVLFSEDRGRPLHQPLSSWAPPGPPTVTMPGAAHQHSDASSMSPEVDAASLGSVEGYL